MVMQLTSNLDAGFELWFSYDRNVGHPYRTNVHLKIMKDSTSTEMEASSYCCAVDNFSKETGRKIALTRLLKENKQELEETFGFTKDDIKTMWEIALPRKVK